jgi:hypothetical protein
MYMYIRNEKCISEDNWWCIGELRRKGWQTHQRMG